MRSPRDAIDTNKSATALRALKVLEALAQSRDALSAAEVAGIIGAERTTAYRMLMTLMEAGYVVRDQRARLPPWVQGLDAQPGAAERQ